MVQNQLTDFLFIGIIDIKIQIYITRFNLLVNDIESIY